MKRSAVILAVGLLSLVGACGASLPSNPALLAEPSTDGGTGAEQSDAGGSEGGFYPLGRSCTGDGDGLSDCPQPGICVAHDYQVSPYGHLAAAGETGSCGVVCSEPQDCPGYEEGSSRNDTCPEPVQPLAESQGGRNFCQSGIRGED